mmetsp:Transcript_14963/g.42294  ORF Transcript_14963/g.42294 Transcript_14963/m.42294 type:complete len:101 (-) Transcript_14963:754-1056(-)
MITSAGIVQPRRDGPSNRSRRRQRKSVMYLLALVVAAAAILMPRGSSMIGTSQILPVSSAQEIASDAGVAMIENDKEHDSPPAHADAGADHHIHIQFCVS